VLTDGRVNFVNTPSVVTRAYSCSNNAINGVQ